MSHSRTPRKSRALVHASWLCAFALLPGLGLGACSNDGTESVYSGDGDGTGGSPCITGNAGCECFANGTCNATLSCLSNLCVQPSNGDGDTGGMMGDTGGMMGDGDGDTGGTMGDGDSGGSGGSESTGGRMNMAGQMNMAGMPDEPQEPAPVIACDSDKDCRAENQVCLLHHNVCVDCTKDADCGGEAMCRDFTCAPFTACNSTKDCPRDEICDEDQSRCIECMNDNDCNSSQVCDDSVCRRSCQSDKDCRAQDGVCDTKKGACVECVSGNDCGEDSFCSSTNTCHPSLCAEREDDICSLVVYSDVDHVVDGSSDEYCAGTGTVFGFESAGYTKVLDDAADTDSSQATVLAAWNRDALHLFVHVVDPAVFHQGAGPHDGDNVQFFVTGEAPSESSVEDGNTQQIYVIPPRGEEPASYSSERELPEGFEYASILVDDGYTVEVQLPWLDVVPSPGDTIGLNVMIGVQDEAGGLDFEYALLLDDIGDALPSQCDSGPEPWCDARHWCTPKVQ